MPTLCRWFDQEFQRLESAGKSALAMSFEPLRAAAFASDVPAALAALPDLYALADAYDEPVWRLVSDYYTIFAETQWRGDLARGLDLATQAVVDSMHEPLARPVLARYLQESLLGVWLWTDAPSYAEDVLSAARDVLSLPLPPDLVARFEIAYAHALVSLDPAFGPNALRTVIEHLPALHWPEAYNRQMMASALAWAGRCDEALTEAVTAAALLESLGHRIEANEAHLFAGALRLDSGDVDEALTTYQHVLSSAGRTINRAHVGFAQAGIGRALLALGDTATGVDWLGAAMETLDGLGWLHAEEDLRAALAAAHMQLSFTTMQDWRPEPAATARRNTPAAPGEDTL